MNVCLEETWLDVGKVPPILMLELRSGRIVRSPISSSDTGQAD
jgi:hypothetical protein